MTQDDPAACTVLLIDDEPFAEDIIAHGLNACAAYTLRYASKPSMAVAIAREIVERQGGTLGIKNRTPNGLKQTLSFERKEADPSTVAPVDAEAVSS